MKSVFSFFFKLYLAILFIVTLLIFYLPILILLFREDTKKKAFPIFVFWSRLICLLAGYRVKPKFAYEVPEAPFVLIANHTSFFCRLACSTILFYFLCVRINHPFFIFLCLSISNFSPNSIHFIDILQIFFFLHISVRIDSN